MTAHRREAGLVALTAFIGALMIMHELLIGRSGFFLDDFRNLADARRIGLSGALLTEPLFEHFSPGHRLMDWVASEPLGRDFRLASGMETAWVAVLLASFAGLLRTIWGAKTWQLVPLAVVALSWPLVATNQWFAAGAHVTPALALTMLSVFLAARWGRTTRPALAAASVTAGFCGALFWVQAVMAPLIAALVLALLVHSAATPREIAISLRRHWVYLAVHALAMAALLVWLATRSWRPDLGSPELDDVFVLGRVVIVRGVLPALVGRGLPNEDLSSADAAWQAASCLVFVAMVVFAVATHRRWIAGLTLMAGTYSAVVGMIAAGRLAQIGPMIGNEPRYVAFLAPMAVLGIVTMLQPTARTPALPSGPRMHLALVALAVGLVGIVGFNVQRSADRSYWRANGQAGKAAAAHLGAQLAQLGPGGGRRLVDTELSPPLAYPADRKSDNTLRRLAPYFVPRLRPLGDATDGTLLRVDGASLVPVEFERLSRPVRISCAPSRPCTAEVDVSRPIPSAVYVQVRAASRVVSAATIAPLVGDATKDDPRAVLRTARPTQMLTGPVWASAVRRVRVAVTVTTTTRVSVALGLLTPPRS